MGTLLQRQVGTLFKIQPRIMRKGVPILMTKVSPFCFKFVTIFTILTFTPLFLHNDIIPEGRAGFIPSNFSYAFSDLKSQSLRSMQATERPDEVKNIGEALNSDVNKRLKEDIINGDVVELVRVQDGGTAKYVLYKINQLKDYDLKEERKSGLLEGEGEELKLQISNPKIVARLDKLSINGARRLAYVKGVSKVFAGNEHKGEAIVHAGNRDYYPEQLLVAVISEDNFGDLNLLKRIPAHEPKHDETTYRHRLDPDYFKLLADVTRVADAIAVGDTKSFKLAKFTESVKPAAARPATPALPAAEVQPIAPALPAENRRILQPAIDAVSAFLDIKVLAPDISWNESGDSVTITITSPSDRKNHVLTIKIRKINNHQFGLTETYRTTNKTTGGVEQRYDLSDLYEQVTAILETRGGVIRIWIDDAKAAGSRPREAVGVAIFLDSAQRTILDYNDDIELLLRPDVSRSEDGNKLVVKLHSPGGAIMTFIIQRDTSDGAERPPYKFIVSGRLQRSPRGKSEQIFENSYSVRAPSDLATILDKLHSNSTYGISAWISEAQTNRDGSAAQARSVPASLGRGTSPIGTQTVPATVDAQKRWYVRQPADLVERLGQPPEAPNAQPVSPQFVTLDLTRIPGVGLITINRSEARNAANPQVLDELKQALIDAQQNPDVKLIAITGTGKVFISGADISVFQGEEGERIDAQKKRMREWGEKGQALCVLIEEVDKEKPVISAINGACLGGGLEIALSTRYIIAVEGALIGSPEITLHLIPGWGGTQRLTRKIGPAKAIPLMLNVVRGPDKKLPTAEDAKERGIINEVVKDESALNAAIISYLTKLTESPAKISTRRSWDDLTKKQQGEVQAVLKNINIRHLREWPEEQMAASLKVVQGNGATIEDIRSRIPAAQAILNAIEIGYANGMQAGLEAELKFDAELITSEYGQSGVKAFIEGKKPTPVILVPHEIPVPAVTTAGLAKRPGIGNRPSKKGPPITHGVKDAPRGVPAAPTTVSQIAAPEVAKLITTSPDGKTAAYTFPNKNLIVEVDNSEPVIDGQHKKVKVTFTSPKTETSGSLSAIGNVSCPVDEPATATLQRVAQYLVDVLHVNKVTGEINVLHLPPLVAGMHLSAEILAQIENITREMSEAITTRRYDSIFPVSKVQSILKQFVIDGDREAAHSKFEALKLTAPLPGEGEDIEALLNRFLTKAEALRPLAEASFLAVASPLPAGATSVVTASAPLPTRGDHPERAKFSQMKKGDGHDKLHPGVPPGVVDTLPVKSDLTIEAILKEAQDAILSFPGVGSLRHDEPKINREGEELSITFYGPEEETLTFRMQRVAVSAEHDQFHPRKFTISVIRNQNGGRGHGLLRREVTIDDISAVSRILRSVMTDGKVKPTLTRWIEAARQTTVAAGIGEKGGLGDQARWNYRTPGVPGPKPSAARPSASKPLTPIESYHLLWYYTTKLYPKLLTVDRPNLLIVDFPRQAGQETNVKFCVPLNSSAAPLLREFVEFAKALNIAVTDVSPEGTDLLAYEMQLGDELRKSISYVGSISHMPETETAENYAKLTLFERCLIEPVVQEILDKVPQNFRGEPPKPLWQVRDTLASAYSVSRENEVETQSTDGWLNLRADMLKKAGVDWELAYEVLESHDNLNRIIRNYRARFEEVEALTNRVRTGALTKSKAHTFLTNSFGHPIFGFTPRQINAILINVNEPAVAGAPAKPLTRGDHPERAKFSQMEGRDDWENLHPGVPRVAQRYGVATVSSPVVDKFTHEDVASMSAKAKRNQLKAVERMLEQISRENISPNNIIVWAWHKDEEPPVVLLDGYDIWNCEGEDYLGQAVLLCRKLTRLLNPDVVYLPGGLANSLRGNNEEIFFGTWRARPTQEVFYIKVKQSDGEEREVMVAGLLKFHDEVFTNKDSRSGKTVEEIKDWLESRRNALRKSLDEKSPYGESVGLSTQRPGIGDRPSREGPPVTHSFTDAPRGVPPAPRQPALLSEAEIMALYKPGYAREHAQRVARLTDRVAGQIGLSQNLRNLVNTMALMHDLGAPDMATSQDVSDYHRLVEQYKPRGRKRPDFTYAAFKQELQAKVGSKEITQRQMNWLLHEFSPGERALEAVQEELSLIIPAEIKLFLRYHPMSRGNDGYQGFLKEIKGKSPADLGISISVDDLKLLQDIFNLSDLVESGNNQFMQVQMRGKQNVENLVDTFRFINGALGRGELNPEVVEAFKKILAANDQDVIHTILQARGTTSLTDEDLVWLLTDRFKSWANVTRGSPEFDRAVSEITSFTQKYPIWAKPWIDQAKAAGQRAVVGPSIAQAAANLTEPQKANIDQILQTTLQTSCPKEKRVGVIMAGGEGTRFFPRGRANAPKQFIELFPGGKTLIQLAIDRLRDPNGPGTIIIQTNAKYSKLVEEAVKGYPEYREGKLLIYGEPAYADNCAALYYAISKIEKDLGADKVVEMYTADHYVPETDYPEFSATIQRLSNLALTQPYIGTVGIRPTRDSTGFGHLKVRQTVPAEGLFASDFTEKPSQDIIDKWKAASEYSLEDDRKNKYFWNAGYFVASISTWFNALEDLAGENVALAGKANKKNNYYELFQRLRAAIGTPQEQEVAAEIFKIMAQWKAAKDPASIDFVVAEPVAGGNTTRAGILMSSGTFFWEDVGSFNALRGLYMRERNIPGEAQNDYNLTTDNRAEFVDCKKVSVIGDGNIQVQAKGLSDVIIAVDGDVVTVVQGHENDQKVKSIYDALKDSPQLKHYAEKREEARLSANLAGQKDPQGNTLAGDTAVLACHNSTLYADRGLVSAYGLQNVTIIRQGNKVYVYGPEYREEAGSFIQQIREERQRALQAYRANPTPLKPANNLRPDSKTPWGGFKILDFKGLPYTGRETTGEAWEASGHPELPCTVTLSGGVEMTLPELLQTAGPEILGRDIAQRTANQMPILFKFLNSASKDSGNLSVQAHPNDAYAEVYEKDPSGKTESWYILDADEGSVLYLGFKKDVDKEQFARDLQDPKVSIAEKYLNAIPVKVGDVFFVPPGTIHAIGRGILLCEIQQSSGTTYRVWDWNRLVNGEPRHLDIDKALDVLNFKKTTRADYEQKPRSKDNATQAIIENNEFFAVDKIRIEANGEISQATNSRFAILTAIKGSVEIRAPNGEIFTTIKKGESILIPAALVEYKIHASENAELLKSFVPKTAQPAPQPSFTPAQTAQILDMQRENVKAWNGQGITGLTVDENSPETLFLGGVPAPINVNQQPYSNFRARGATPVSSLANIISPALGTISEGSRDDINHLMIHGHLPIPAELVPLIGQGLTDGRLHDTYFGNGSPLFAGTSQYRQSGGHSQLSENGQPAFDLKYVTEGQGVQSIVYKGRDGKLHTIIHYLKPGTWALALPGTIDYVVNLGGLRFNDVSFAVNEATLGQIRNTLGIADDFDQAAMKVIIKNGCPVVFSKNGDKVEEKVDADGKFAAAGLKDIVSHRFYGLIPELEDAQVRGTLLNLYRANPQVLVEMMENPRFTIQTVQRLRPRKELGFGTSGLRDFVVNMTDRECYINTVGYINYLVRKGYKKKRIAVAGDLRDSTDNISRAVIRAIEDSGFVVDYCGKIPTPALANYALSNGIACIMVTGSHIPEDQNGIKYYLWDGEVLKDDEPGILVEVVKVKEEQSLTLSSASLFDEKDKFKPGMAPNLPLINTGARERYIQRYLSIFSPDTFRGKRIGIYQHSAVGRDIMVEVFQALGATAIPIERSETFIPVDSESLPKGIEEKVKGWIKEYNLDAVISADGDTDRPLLFDEQGRFLWGDILGAVVAKYLGADFVAVTATTNDGVYEHLRDQAEITVTRVGSPYVIRAMMNAVKKGHKKVVSWEGNGGFLTQTYLEINGKKIKPLPTRDAIFPLICALHTSVVQNKTMSQVVDGLPQRFKFGDRIKDFPVAVSKKIISRFSPPKETKIKQVTFKDEGAEVIYYASDALGEEYLDSEPELLSNTSPQLELLMRIKAELEKYFTDEDGFGEIISIGFLDGIRIRFKNNQVAHLRPSGNSPEFRAFSNAGTQVRADEIVKKCLEKIVPNIRNDIEVQPPLTPAPAPERRKTGVPSRTAGAAGTTALPARSAGRAPSVLDEVDPGYALTAGRRSSPPAAPAAPALARPATPRVPAEGYGLDELNPGPSYSPEKIELSASITADDLKAEFSPEGVYGKNMPAVLTDLKGKTIELIISRSALGAIEEAKVIELIEAINKNGLDITVKFVDISKGIPATMNFSKVYLIGENDIDNLEAYPASQARVLAINNLTGPNQITVLHKAIFACLALRSLEPEDIMNPNNKKVKATIKLYNSIDPSSLDKLDFLKLSHLLYPFNLVPDLRLVLRQIVANLPTPAIATGEIDKVFDEIKQAVGNI